MTPDEIAAFLKEPHIAHLATVRPDGTPHVVPVWFLYDGASIIVITEPDSVKVRNIRRNPRVSVCVATDQRPYRYVIVGGTAEISFDGVPELLRAISVHYMGERDGNEYADSVLGDGVFCKLTVSLSRVTGWTGEA